MARRPLSPGEVSTLGLSTPVGPTRRALSPQQAASLGLPATPTVGPTLAEGVAAGGRMLRQGANPFWDEMAGVGEAWQQGASKLLGGEIPTPMSTIDAYRQGRDESRAADKQAETALDTVSPALAPGLRLAGGVGVGLLTGGAGYGAAALEGAAGALGVSEADLTRPTPQNLGVAALETGAGAAFGAAGKGAADLFGAGADKVRAYLLRKAGAGKAAAQELAEAQAKDLVGKQVQQARSAAGSAASNARNVDENIEGINLPTENIRRTVGERMRSVVGQIDALDDALEAATARARAMGVDPDDIASGRMGAFLSKGSKLDKAQKAAKSIEALRAAREQLVGEYQALGKRAADELLPDEYGALREAQAALRSDPRLEDLKQNVLKNSLQDFDRVSVDAVAKREAFQQALAAQGQDEAAMAQRLLSGEEARAQLGQRLQRYGAPLVGSALGAGAGAAVGLATGGDPGEMAVYALGGAGLRPALQSFKRLAQQPAVQHAAWSSLERLAKAAPQSFGRFSRAVAAAVARGPEALKALDKVLRDTSPEWRRIREQQEKQAAQR